MARHKNAVRPVIWGIKLSLYPGVDDDLIALRKSTPDGQQAALIKHSIRYGRPTPVTAETDADLEARLADLL